MFHPFASIQDSIHKAGQFPDRICQKIFDLPLKETRRRLPSMLRTAVKQRIQAFKPLPEFPHGLGPSVMMVPGLFCLPSVMTRLGQALSERNLDVYFPHPFPNVRKGLANTAGILPAADVLEQDLADLFQAGIKEITLVGHSMGGLIALEVRRRIMEGETQAELPQIKALYTLATPFDGAALARLLRRIVPACRDIMPESPEIERLKPYTWLVDCRYCSTADLLVPRQMEPDGDRAIAMEGFQHMDFYVGSEEKIALTADLLKEKIGG